MMNRLKVTRKVLMEATRSQLINKSKRGDSYALSNQHKGKNRWERRKYSKIATQVKDFNSIDMNALFKGDMLEFTIPVQGETNNYKVVILFEKVLEEIAEQVKRNNNKLEYKCILRALLRVFNSDAVYVSCSCEDFRFRFQFWSTKNQYNSGTPQASNGKGIANPNDTKGAACKHINLCLANLNWMMKIASVINNYIWYCKDNMEYNYAEYIFPKVYGMPYDKAIQLTFDNFDANGNPITDPDLATDVATINLANAIGKRRTQFKKAPEKSVNPRYVPPKKEKPIPNKLGLNLDDEGTNESLIEKIVKIGDKWQVQSEQGRNMGTYDTKEEAEKRLKQIEYFKNLDEALIDTLKSKGFKFNNNPVKGASYLLPDGSFLSMEENKAIIGSINGKATHPDLDFWLLDNNLVDINSNEGNRALIKSDNAIRLNDGTNFVDEAATISLPSDPLTSSQITQLQNWLVETIYLTGAKRIDVGDETTDSFQSFDIDLDVEDNIEAIMSFIQTRYR